MTVLVFDAFKQNGTRDYLVTVLACRERDDGKLEAVRIASSFIARGKAHVRSDPFVEGFVADYARNGDCRITGWCLASLDGDGIAVPERLRSRLVVRPELLHAVKEGIAVAIYGESMAGRG